MMKPQRKYLPDFEKTRAQSAAATAAASMLKSAMGSAVTSALCTDEAPRFAADDPDALPYLSDNGYVVIRDVLCESEVATAYDLLWDFLSGAVGWQKGRMETWDECQFGRIGLPEVGIVKAAGAGQSEFVWYIRTRSAVRDAFARLWGTDKLIAAFDGFNIFLPWHHKQRNNIYCQHFKKTIAGWFHCDQGPAKNGLNAVQGFVSVTSQNASTGGLLVIPGSHHLHESWVSAAARCDDDDFVQVPRDSPLLRLPHRLVTCMPGDLVLWDSRLIHCNMPAVESPASPEGELLRVAAYVCMLPKKLASKENLEVRTAAYIAGMSCNHWPIIKRNELRDFDNADGFKVKSLGEADDGREQLVR